MQDSYEAAVPEPGVASNGHGKFHSKDQVVDEFSSSETSSTSDQQGVKTIEAIAKTWSPLSLGLAYLGLFLIVTMTSLEGQTTAILATIATSSFNSFGLISAVYTVQSILLAVVKPPMAKIANVFGRTEAYCIAITLYVLGYIQQAASSNIRAYAAAQIFYSAGSTGLQVLNYIFIADTTNLRWRVLIQACITDIPFLWTTWVGPVIAGKIESETTWRWGYGIWAIVLPVSFLPLLVSLIVNGHKAKKAGTMPPSPYKGLSPLEVIKDIWYDLDFFGLLLLTAGLTLVLLPLTLANDASRGWRTPSMIVMIVIGGVIMILFPFWERSKKLAPKAFFPRDLFRQRTVTAGTVLAFFYFMAYYMSVQPYFNAYLLTVQGLSVTAAAHVSQTFDFASSATAVVTGYLIWQTKHYKYWITFGSCIYLLGIGLMIKYRDINTSTGSLVGTQIAVGIGGGMVNTATLLGVQASASHGQVASATAVWLTILEVGGAVGNAVSGAIWTSQIPKKLEAYLPASAKSQAKEIALSTVDAYTLYAKGTPERAAIDRAYQETMRILLICAVCLCVPLIPLSLIMKNFQLSKMDQKVEGLVIGGSTETTGASEAQMEDPQYRQTRARRFPKMFQRSQV